MKSMLALSFLLAFCFSTGFSATIHVPNDHPTIQAAVNAAISGDMIVIAPGIWTGPGNRDINITSKLITIVSEQGPDTCIIDCQDFFTQYAGFTITNCAPGVTLQGLSIVNANSNLQSAVKCDASVLTLINCIIQNNRSYTNSVVNCANSSLTFTDCLFSDNVSLKGGGAGITSCTGEITGCIFTSNIAEGYGGAIYFSDSSVLVSDCEITENTVFNGEYGLNGGGIFVDSYNDLVTIDNCLILNNSTPFRGGGIYQEGNLILSRSTIAGNLAESGGGIYCIGANELVIGGEIDQANTFDSNMAMFGADLNAHCQMGKINAKANIFKGSYLSDYYVSNPGCFNLESSSAELLLIEQDVYVSPDGNDSNDGLTPETPFKSIHHALKNIGPSKSSPITIYLQPGTYSRSTTGETFPLPLLNELSVIGSDDPTETIIDAEEKAGLFGASHDTVSISGVSLTGSIRGGVQAISSSLTISNCHISNNLNTSNCPESLTDGGGVSCDSCQLDISDCLITDNHSAGAGGGIFYSYHSTDYLPLRMERCNILRNLASSDGGGIYFHVRNIDLDTSHIANNIIENNTAIKRGGGLYCHQYDTYPIDPIPLECCQVRRNQCGSDQSGGGLCVQGYWSLTRCDISENIGGLGGALGLVREVNCTLTNCLISANNSTDGAVSLKHSSKTNVSIINCNIIENIGSGAQSAGLNLTGNYDARCNVKNSILWGNESQQILWTDDDDRELTIANCCIEGGFPGSTNISNDPGFKSTTNYHLRSHSPCIDAGDSRNDFFDLDFDGNPRNQAGDIDIGAFEYAGWPGLVRPYIEMGKTEPQPGDIVDCTVTIWNPSESTLTGYPFFVMLELFGEIYFAPQFNAFDYYERDFPPGLTTVTILPEFEWPSGAGTTWGPTWFATFTNPEISTFYGHIDTLIFGWRE